MNNLYVHYGCGLSAPDKWLNFDASPSLRIQKLPLIGKVAKRKMKVIFPENVLYGDIVKGLPVEDNSCIGIYCSHILEHLSLEDFRIALKNTYRILKPDGIFRCLVPDLEVYARKYIQNTAQGNKLASIDFIQETLLGLERRPRGIKNFFISFFGNAHHLWMWDSNSLTEELKSAGFKNIRLCQFNDCSDSMFREVEDPGRFIHSVAVECTK
ncbi:MAG: methyltransferase domain-containing protein [Bacteroidales bacterium]